MRWRFWQKDAELFDAPLVASPATARPAAVDPADDPVDEPADDPGATPGPPRRPVPAAGLPELPDGPAAPPAVLVTTGLAVDEVVRLVRLLVDRRPAPMSVGPPEQAAPVALSALALRLPALAGVSGPVENDLDARQLLLAYAGLLATRAEPLRRRCTSGLPRELLPAVAREACGEPGVAATAKDRLLAACVLLAQTSADGAAAPEAIPGELERARRR